MSECRTYMDLLMPNVMPGITRLKVSKHIRVYLQLVCSVCPAVPCGALQCPPSVGARTWQYRTTARGVVFAALQRRWRHLQGSWKRTAMEEKYMKYVPGRPTHGTKGLHPVGCSSNPQPGGCGIMRPLIRDCRSHVMLSRFRPLPPWNAPAGEKLPRSTAWITAWITVSNLLSSQHVTTLWS